jgi:hypothetical protein
MTVYVKHRGRLVAWSDIPDALKWSTGVWDAVFVPEGFPPALVLCDLCSQTTLRARYEEAWAAGEIDWPFTYCANCESPPPEKV